MCGLGRWNTPDGPILAFLGMLEEHMLYVPDDTPAEVDPEELRATERMIGAPFDRVRVDQYLCMRRPVICFFVDEVSCVDPCSSTR